AHHRRSTRSDRGGIVDLRPFLLQLRLQLHPPVVAFGYELLLLLARPPPFPLLPSHSPL
ncbi:hypothetical protein LINPERPRIM_LOCUS22620, partial [Linum perenne]